MYVIWHTFRRDRIYSMVTFGIIGITLLAGVSLAHNHQNPNQNFLLLRRYYDVLSPSVELARGEMAERAVITVKGR